MRLPLVVAAAMLLCVAASGSAHAETVAVRENVKARSLRAADSPSTGRLPPKTALTVLKRDSDASGSPWVKLTYRKTTGWVPLASITRAPKPGCRSRATGRPSAGGLFCGKLLDSSNELWVTYNPVTGDYPNAAARRWGMDSTLAAIETVTLDYWRKFRDAPRIVVGDISLRGGGAFGAHASHQQGLDVDVYYPRRGGGPALTPRGPGEVDRTRAQWLVERFAAERAQVVYVGVRVGVRRSRANIAYLGSGHETHFHVRLAR